MENQQRADQRIPLLFSTGAEVRWVSIEPMLGSVALASYLYERCGYCRGTLPALRRPDDERVCGRPYWGKTNRVPKLDWVIVGAESGPDRRPFDPDWARAVRGDCLEAGVPFLYKQGSHLYPGRRRELDGREWKQFPGEEVCGERAARDVVDAVARGSPAG